MGTEYLMDTNVVIEFLADNYPSSATDWLQDMMETQGSFLSVINKIELLGYRGEVSEMRLLEEFVKEISVLPLSDQVVQQTIILRKAHRIKLPDAIIAATAQVHQLCLLTRNTGDFNIIGDLQVLNPYNML